MAYFDLLILIYLSIPSFINSSIYLTNYIHLSIILSIQWSIKYYLPIYWFIYLFYLFQIFLSTKRLSRWPLKFKVLVFDTDLQPVYCWELLRKVNSCLGIISDNNFLKEFTSILIDIVLV